MSMKNKVFTNGGNSMKKSFKSLLTMLLVVSLLMSNFAMIATYAALDPYPVELAFNNIFVFEKWANNTLSSTIIADGVPLDKDKDGFVEDIETGSFILTKKNTAAAEVYTAFSMGTTNASENSGYYTMSVEPNTVYTFSYHLSGDMAQFTPFVFMYNSSGLYETMVSYTSPNLNGYNSFEFTTPADITSIQIRFTITDLSGKEVSATVNDITICKFDVIHENLFDFDSWANSEKSPLVASAFGYDDGIIVPNTDTDSLYMETDTDPSKTSGQLYTAFSFDSNEGYYAIDVEPNTAYTLSYNIVDCNVGDFQPYIVFNDETGAFKQYINHVTTAYGVNNFTFTTDSDVSYICKFIKRNNQAQQYICCV